ncbi:MAG: DEAD/DEAH box helicase [Promethearchaeota archaeon]
MSLISRDFFIVLNRNQGNLKDLLYDINFFYLKSFKEKNFTFSYINKPFFQGSVTFGLDFKNKMRPVNFTKFQKGDSTEPLDPHLFKKFLLADKNRFVAFSSQTDNNEFIPVNSMLESFQFDKKKIIKLTFCKSCLNKRIFKILSGKQKILSYHDAIICSNCALELILKEAAYSGLVLQDRIDPKLKNFFNHMILKFRNVGKVLKTFKTEFNPIKNEDLTLYDIEKTPTVSEKYLNLKIADISIPKEFKDLLFKQNIKTLLPIQAISLDKGLISEGNNQLIMAPTSAGKTLVAELAGISRVITEKLKMLYLVPIVALANVRTEEFKKKYKSLNLKIIKKVGESILEKRDNDNPNDLMDASVIIATYEAIDYLLRSGNKQYLGNIGTIIIDEIQTLIDNERGFILDGLISRLKFLYPNSQYMYLSATIGAPQDLADNLDCTLIRYNNRPVPIERHLLLCLNENVKYKYIVKLIRSSYSRISKYGFKGQTIVFTNTRKKCEALATYLQDRQVKARPYHSGLTYEERKIVEIEFQKQKISAVVATAALAAGVDFPAKQVIFESLGMGIKILTVAEFEQMLGRAGRLMKHEKGLAYLLVEPSKIYSPKLKLTEENIAISLLNGKIKDYQLDPNGDRSLTELLAFFSIFQEFIPKSDANSFYNSLINGNYDLDSFIDELVKMRLIIGDQITYKPTDLGIAIAKSFLTIEQGLDLINKLKNKRESLIDIVLNLKPLKNVYLSKKIVADLSRNVNMKYFSNNFFSNSVLSLMNAEYVKKRKKFSDSFIKLITKWTSEFFNCSCKDNPYCECGRLNLERIILNLRTENQLSIDGISDYLMEEFSIQVFKGDIIDYLESLIYSFESLFNISQGLPKLDPNYKKELSDIPEIIRSIKN